MYIVHRFMTRSKKMDQKKLHEKNKKEIYYADSARF